MKSARYPIMLLLIAVIVLGLPGIASAHKLSVKDADRAVTKIAKRIAANEGLDRGWADGCRRKSGHQVDCKLRTKGVDTGLGAIATCKRNAQALYKKHGSDKITVLVSNTVTCNYTYPQPPAECEDGADNDGDGKTDTADPDCSDANDDSESPPLVAPDTQLTEGPADGGTVQGDDFGDGNIKAFVSIGMTAVGGTDPFFQCSEDGGPYEFCGAGQTWTTSVVFEGVGGHTLGVRACSGWGSGQEACDATPVIRSFEVVVRS